MSYEALTFLSLTSVAAAFSSVIFTFILIKKVFILEAKLNKLEESAQ